jgi:hypothetical protein
MDQQRKRDRMRIIVAKEKHETRYLDARDDAALGRSALRLLRERLPRWYYGADKRRAERILAEQNGEQAWKFLWAHRDYEYEEVEMVCVEETAA